MRVFSALTMEKSFSLLTWKTFKSKNALMSLLKHLPRHFISVYCAKRTKNHVEKKNILPTKHFSSFHFLRNNTINATFIVFSTQNKIWNEKIAAFLSRVSEKQWKTTINEQQSRSIPLFYDIFVLFMWAVGVNDGNNTEIQTRTLNPFILNWSHLLSK